MMTSEPESSELDFERSSVLRILLTGAERERLHRLWKADAARDEFDDLAEYARRILATACEGLDDD